VNRFHGGRVSVNNLVCSIQFHQHFSSNKLVPLFLGKYTFKGKQYQFLIHGVTSNIVADYPLSNIRKVESFIKFLCTLIGLIFLLIFVQYNKGIN